MSVCFNIPVHNYYKSTGKNCSTAEQWEVFVSQPFIIQFDAKKIAQTIRQRRILNTIERRGIKFCTL